VLGNLGSLLGGGGGAPADGGGLLGSSLGGNQSSVQHGVQQASGLGSDQTRKLLMMLAPIVMGALAKRAQNHGRAHEDPNELTRVLQEDGAQAHQQAQSTGMGGILGKILSMGG
jgi:hypothetical protein